MNSVSILANVNLFGGLGLELDQEFPQNPRPGMLWLKGGVLHAYVAIANQLYSWLPLTKPSRMYVHRQVVASDTWVVNHSLHMDELWYQIQDETGQIMSASITRNSLDQMTVQLSAPRAGVVLVVASDDLELPEMTAVVGTFGDGKITLNRDGVFYDGERLLGETAVKNLIGSTPGVGSGDGASAEDLTAAVTTLEAADTALGQRIDSAIADSQVADATLTQSVAAVSSRVDQEIADRLAAETSIQDQMGSLNSTVAGVQASVQTATDATTQAVADEQAARENADNNLQTNLTSESEARQAAVTDLMGRVSSEETARIDADNAVRGDLNAAIGTAVANLVDGAPTDGNTLNKLRTLIAGLQTLMGSDDVNLDTVQELVTRLKSDEGLITSLTTNKVNVADIVDSLASTAVDRPLSANQGRALNALIAALQTAVNGKANTSALATVATSGSYTDLINKPTLSAVAASGSYADLLNKPVLAPVATSGAYSSLTGTPTLAPVATSGLYSDLTGRPTLSTVAATGNYSDLAGKPVLSAVATSGAYADLTGRPTLSTVAATGNYSDLAGRPSLSPVATSGSYSDLTGKPIPLAVVDNLTSTDATAALSANQGRVLRGQVAALGTVQSKRDFVNGTLVTTSIDYSQTNGSPFLVEIEGNSYGNSTPFLVRLQGYIYNDGLYNIGGFSAGAPFPTVTAMNVGGKLCFWWPRQSYWQGFEVFVSDVDAAGTKSNTVISISDTAVPAGATKQVVIPIKQALFYSDVVDNLTTQSATAPLSANQGYVLSQQIGAIDAALTTLLAG